jgi:putative transposase
VVRRRFKVDYTLAGLGRLLHRAGWSVQVPARQAAERNEEQIAAWKEESWLAALIAVKPGQRARLICRVHHGGRRRNDRRKGFTETGCAWLLDAACQQLAGPIVLVWDNLTVHVSAAMAALAAARPWLTACRLPAYAHELNPVEPAWSHLKRPLANLAKRNLTQLTALVKTRLKRMQYRPGLLGGFLAGTGLGLAPFGNPHCGCFSGIAAGRRLRARR